MTATIPERSAVDVGALRDDLAAVLEAHGIDASSLSVTPILQGGLYAGVKFSGHQYDRPAELPAVAEVAPRLDQVAALMARYRDAAEVAA